MVESACRSDLPTNYSYDWWFLDLVECSEDTIHCMEMSFPDIPLKDDNKVDVQLPLSEQEASKMHCLMGFV